LVSKKKRTVLHIFDHGDRSIDEEQPNMEWREIWVMSGPNPWAGVPVFEVECILKELASWTSAHSPAVANRLIEWLPGLNNRTSTSGRGGTCADQLRHGSSLAEMLLQLALELQCEAGSPVSFGLTRPTNWAAVHRVVFEYEEEPLARACLETARAALLAAVHGQPYDLPARLSELRDLGYDVRFGPSTAAIVRAARQRGIPVRRLGQGNLVQLGHGARQRRIWTAETDRTSAVGEAIAQDKHLTRRLLQEAAVPVPEGRPVDDADDACAAAEQIGFPVVVKPQDGNQGRGVATGLSTPDQVRRAYEAARTESSCVLVERHITGRDYRVLVVGDRVVAAALREPAQVVGDGDSTVTQLVELVNRDPRRSDGHGTALSRIKFDAIALAVLAEQGYAPESVPPADARVLIRRNANLSTGGTATDVTDLLHPEVARRAVEAAQVVGLDVAGVDIVADDVRVPLEVQGGAIVEVNAGPGLRMHLEPSAGQPRPVGEAIVGLLFPEGQTGRIPVVAVTGVNGKTTVTRLIDHILRRGGWVVGMSCTDGMHVGGRRIRRRDCSGPQSARGLLLHPSVTAAVLETARGGILREGLAFDRCDVAVVTNIGGGDHLGLRGVATVEELARVKRTVVEAVAATGAAVLNAADPLVAAMASHCPGTVIYFARDANHRVVAAHRAAGGRAVFVRDGSIILATGGAEERVVALTDVPLTHGGGVGFQVENVLAAVAATWWLGQSPAVVRAALATFRGDPAQLPGRFNVFKTESGPVIVDYAHNATALAGLIEALDEFPHDRRTLVFTGCISYRREQDILRMGRVAADGFDRVIVYDNTAYSSSNGAPNRMFLRGLTDGDRLTDVVETPDELTAVKTALETAEPGELVVIGVEDIPNVLAYLQDHLASRPKRTLPAEAAVLAGS
jgi:cyanophycin synthetase